MWPDKFFPFISDVAGSVGGPLTAGNTTSTITPGPHSGTAPQGQSCPSPLHCVTTPSHRPGYESVQSSHRSRDLPLTSPLPPTVSLPRTHSPGGSPRMEGAVRTSTSLPRESSTQASPTQEQLTSSTSTPTQSSTQPSGGTPTIVVTRNLHRRRPSTRHQLYMSRNTLHHELQLPDGYGEWEGGQALVLTCAPLSAEQRTTPQGQMYFIHRATGVSTWHDPRFRDLEVDQAELGSLTDGWEIRYTAHGRRYFVDHINRTTQFTGICCLTVSGAVS